MSINITIEDESGKKQYIQAKALEEISDSHIGGIHNMLFLLRGAFYVKEQNPEPSYSRAQVLKEEWGLSAYDIENCNTCHQIFPDNTIQKCGGVYCHVKPISIGVTFAPSRELAEEIVQIRLGKWLPKKGDEVFACGKNNLRTFYESGKYSEVYRFIANKDFGGNACDYDRIFFPSEKQRDTFIEKQKEKETILPKCKHGYRNYIYPLLNCPQCFPEKDPSYFGQVNGRQIFQDENGFLKSR